MIHPMFEILWRDYAAITPSAPRLHALLQARGERIVNDHVAFRTFDLAPIALDDLAPAVLGQGYVESGRYTFPEKKLRAMSFRDPTGERPRIFLSELLTASFSERLQAVARTLVNQVERRGLGALTHPPGWAPVPLETYLALLAESEYAGWLVAFGLRANHFTVSVNALRTFDGLPSVNTWLVANGFVLNEAGGVIKGTTADLLEQDTFPRGWKARSCCLQTCLCGPAVRATFPESRRRSGSHGKGGGHRTHRDPCSVGKHRTPGVRAGFRRRAGPPRLGKRRGGGFWRGHCPPGRLRRRRRSRRARSAGRCG